MAPHYSRVPYKSDDGSPPRRIANQPVDDVLTVLFSFAPDGAGVVASRIGADQKADLYFIAIPAAPESVSELRPIVTGPGFDAGGTISPDGRWLAYNSDESGRAEIYVAAFRGASPVSDALRVTKSGGTLPSWSADGRTFRYVDPSQRVMAVPVTTSPTLTVGSPVPLFDAQKLNVLPSDVLPDGRQFVVMRGEEESDEVRRLSVVLNFNQELVEKMKSAK